MSFHKTIYIFIFISLATTVQVFSQIKLPAIFSDNMILQQQSETPIWGWAKAGSDISLSTSWDKEIYTTKADKSGKWRLAVKTPVAGGPYEISISGDGEIQFKNVLIGEVWLCSGQSNMEMPMKGFKGQPIINSNEDILKSKNKNIRLITVPRNSKTAPQEDFQGHWSEASPETVSDFSATGYYFGRLLNEILDVPVGLINVSYGGSNVEAWMDAEWLRPLGTTNIPKDDKEIGEPNRTPTVLYNGMLSPVIGYGIKGCIWYQGESNQTSPDKYELLFETMVEKWRATWGQGEFPFYYAQIAPYDYAWLTPNEVNEKYNSAYLRDAQRKAMYQIPNCGMAVLMDCGEKDNIHPADKKKAGDRLSYLALGKTYDIKGFGYASPEYDTMTVSGNIVTVTFKNIPNGITSFGKELTCFEIAGADKKFYPATAVMRRKSVLLSSPNVAEPVAVRYAFKDFIVGDLFSTEGLPLSSFRTDNW